MEKIYRHLKIGILVFIMVLFSQHAYATGIRISWQPSSGDDVAGYNVYYGTVSGDYDNMIDVGDVTTVDIGDLENDTYFFAVTAYNYAGEESAYSEEIEVSTGSEGQSEVLPGGSDSSGGGGGGGGCFLSASSAHGSHYLQVMAFLTAMLSVLVHRYRKNKAH
jgi:hypothetical protein